MKKLSFLIACLVFVCTPAFALVTGNFPIVTSGNMASAVYSIPVRLTNQIMVSIQAVFTGAPSGTMNIQVSDDVGVVQTDGTVTGIVNWSDYTGSSIAISSAGNQSWDVWQTSFKWVRLAYIADSGSGLLTARANIKGQ